MTDGINHPLRFRESWMRARSLPRSWTRSHRNPCDQLCQCSISQSTHGFSAETTRIKSARSRRVGIDLFFLLGFADAFFAFFLERVILAFSFVVASADRPKLIEIGCPVEICFGICRSLNRLIAGQRCVCPVRVRPALKHTTHRLIGLPITLSFVQMLENGVFDLDFRPR
jgi:hypothetical protein